MTLLDILDSNIINIAFGAFIGGLASHFSDKRKYKYELQKDLNNDRKNITRELSIKLEYLQSQINEAAFHYTQKRIEESQKAILPASDAIYTACALANILGNEKLVYTLDELSRITEKMFNALNDEPENSQQLTEFSHKIGELKMEAYPYIREEYNKG